MGHGLNLQANAETSLRAEQEVTDSAAIRWNSFVPLKSTTRVQHIAVSIMKPEKIYSLDDPEHQCMLAQRHVSNPHAEDRLGRCRHTNDMFGKSWILSCNVFLPFLNYIQDRVRILNGFARLDLEILVRIRERVEQVCKVLV